MLGNPIRDRRSERREATRAEILAAAWEQVQAEGLAALSLRDLARRVGMQAPSLYSYFDSKHALYDAMFADGYRQLLEEVRGVEGADDPRDALKQAAHFMVRISTGDVPLYQLLFTRTIPGFEPTTESYALALEFFEQGRERAAAAGIRTDHDFDLYTAVIAGLSSQQLANDPGGDRWLRLVDETVDMLIDHVNAKVNAKGGR